MGEQAMNHTTPGIAELLDAHGRAEREWEAAVLTGSPLTGPSMAMLTKEVASARAAVLAHVADLEAQRDEALKDAGRMEDALRVMARQKLSAEVSEEDRDNADYEAGYEALVRQARAAIAQRGGNDA